MLGATEDGGACAVLGVRPRWLPFGSVDFERHGDDDGVWAAVPTRSPGARVVLVPGTPLAHPDHAWLPSAPRGADRCDAVALYAEQPYTRRSRRRRRFARTDSGARPLREVARRSARTARSSAARDAATAAWAPASSPRATRSSGPWATSGSPSAVMKLVMTLLVRDEADIVDAQIAFHLDAGVDFVVATDNRSEDGTTAILERYAREASSTSSASRATISARPSG